MFTMVEIKMLNKQKNGQEEMVGFAVIVILVSLILVFFLVFSLNTKPQTNSYEVSSFMQSALHYTTACQINGNYVSVNDLISSCVQNETCSNQQNSCDILNQTLSGIMDKSWPSGQNFPVKGYNLTVISNFGNVLSIQKGNITATYKGAPPELLPTSIAKITVYVTIYY